MCGINGITRRDRALVERMNAATAHRGPDGVGLYESDQVTLGHNRLAIIDLSERGAQPMKSADGSLVITYNGELYNYRELRAELSDYAFTSETDTEVVLAAYAKWGVGCLKRFNGIFAFALWDGKRGELLLARDQMGVKPLYYAVAGDAVCFSSEIKAILEAGIDRTLDRAAFSRYMRITDVTGPSTLFKNVKKLPPAHYAVVKGSVVTPVEYWKADIHTKERESAQVWHDRILETLDASVARQLVSDRPVGVFLSGGIDSSAVLESAVRAKGVMRTFTTRFEVDSPEEEEKFNRDAELAKRTAKLFNTDHTEVTVKRADVIPLLEEAVWHLDEPSGSATALSQLAIARVASKDVAVVLGGDGGDELFGGYERYRLSRLMDLYQRLPRVVRALLSGVARFAKLDTPPGFRRFALFHLVKDEDLNKVLAAPFAADHATSEYTKEFFSGASASFLDTLMDADRRLLADGSLLRTDKLSMAAGLEARVPLLDIEMIRLAGRIPAEGKVSLGATKKLFKDALRKRLPGYLFTEPKRGWFAPSGMWLQHPEMHKYLKEVLSPSYYAPTAELFNWKGIDAMLEDHYRGVKPQRALLWALLSFQVWARRFTIVV